jgi:hypothetical protein
MDTTNAKFLLEVEYFNTKDWKYKDLYNNLIESEVIVIQGYSKFNEYKPEIFNISKEEGKFQF